MPETRDLHPNSALATRDSLAVDLRSAGLAAGEVVLVHSSLRSLGFVCGGAVAVVQALQDVLTAEGTLAMPAHSAGLSEPSRWRHPPAPEAWWETIRATMPAFDARLTPTLRMGAIAEAFRSFEGVLRSAHPSGSFTAWGRRAEEVTRGHALDVAFGEGSPLARLYDVDARVLLLGVGHEANTSLHLAEVRWGGLAPVEEGAPLVEDDGRVWRRYRDLDYDADDFPRVGDAFAATGGVTTARIGVATALVFRQREIVDFAADWMRVNRQ